MRVAGHEINVSNLRIEHPYTIEPAEPLPRELPVLMVICNNGAEADRLVAVEAGQAGSAGFVGRPASGADAVPVGAIDLPAYSQTVLGPKTAHVVLRDLHETIQGYQYFPISLVFEKAGRIEVEVYVEDRE
jgi:copper(I)-binding protein